MQDEEIAELKTESAELREACEVFAELNVKLEQQLERQEAYYMGDRAELAALRGLLKIARCPNTECCLGSIPHQVGDHEWIAQQCQFCHERALLLQEKGE